MRFSPSAVASRILFALALLAAFAAHAQRPDYEREKRWADEIVPGLVVGQAVWLQAGAPQKFLGLYTEAKNAKGAIVLVHGTGVHPDYGLIGGLRVRLADAGYSTLSIQMPILAADAPAEGYRALFTEATGRIGAAVSWLRGKRYRKIVLVSHSMGSRMANHYVARNPKVPLKAWVAVSITSGGFEPFGRPRFPVFDVYAEKDYEAVLNGVERRAAVLKRMRGSSQAMVFGTDHFFAGKEKELASLIQILLEGEKK